MASGPEARGEPHVFCIYLQIVCQHCYGVLFQTRERCMYNLLSRCCCLGFWWQWSSYLSKHYGWSSEDVAVSMPDGATSAVYMYKRSVGVTSQIEWKTISQASPFPPASFRHHKPMDHASCTKSTWRSRMPLASPTRQRSQFQKKCRAHQIWDLYMQLRWSLQSSEKGHVRARLSDRHEQAAFSAFHPGLTPHSLTSWPVFMTPWRLEELASLTLGRQWKGAPFCAQSLRGASPVILLWHVVTHRSCMELLSAGRAQESPTGTGKTLCQAQRRSLAL